MNRYEKLVYIDVHYQSKLTYAASSIVECTSSKVAKGSILKHARGMNRLDSVVGLVASFSSAVPVT